MEVEFKQLSNLTVAMNLFKVVNGWSDRYKKENPDAGEYSLVLFHKHILN